MKIMALTNSSISEARQTIASNNSARESNRESAISYLGKAQASGDYQAWVAGTEFGSTFADKFAQLSSVADKLAAQGEELNGKLQNFLNRQMELNQTGH